MHLSTPTCKSLPPRSSIRDIPNVDADGHREELAEETISAPFSDLFLARLNILAEDEEEKGKKENQGGTRRDSGVSP
ncbi:hypothetical protein DPEC_G00286590 [Dallia pectoralis]|uniref:Uncharacterized protein n=1 Tax=Dallia pectoralis TaxID=75939 RepID=A0ACC2FJZ1_DALPE|nr:hypothetical protein DPEC_G00286590 [Dallia pectoralis]